MMRRLFLLSCLLGLLFSANSQREIVLPEASNIEYYLFEQGVFKVIPKGDIDPLYYDGDLKLLKEIPPESKYKIPSMYIGIPLGYAFDEVGRMHALVQDGYVPANFSVQVFTPEAIKANNPKLIESKTVIVLPDYGIDVLIKNKQHKGKYLFKSGWSNIYNAKIFGSHQMICRVGAVDGDVQWQIVDVDLFTGKIIHQFELHGMDVGSEYVWSAHLYQRFNDEAVSGFYSIVLLSDTKQPSNYGKLTAVFTSYDLDGRQLKQKAYPFTKVYKREVDFAKLFGSNFYMSNINTSDGYSFMLDDGDGTVLFMDEEFNIIKEYAWGSGVVKDTQIPAQYVYLLNKWNNSVTENPSIAKKCPHGPRLCGRSNWSPTGDANYFFVSLNGRRYVYYSFFNERYLALMD